METYKLPDHPDSRLESDHLQSTRDHIDAEILQMEAETGAKADELDYVQIIDDPDLDDETSLNIFLMKLDRLRQLSYSRNQAYFARLDFIPDNGSPETWYLGRWGVLREDLSVEVVDWRSPVANLYYSGQLGRVDYEAPDGRVSGELKLKRMLSVHDRQLESIFDTDIVNRDQYLQGVLGNVSSDRLREIVTTIQGEQNTVIRHPFRQDLIVQGVAGSGKTTIALHRIAYLLYVHRDVLRPEKMMILAPTPLFLSYISKVLPDLGVERVIQTTFADWCFRHMKKDGLKLHISHRLEDRLSTDPNLFNQTIEVTRLKGSLEMMDRVERFLTGFSEEILPKEGLVLSGVSLFSYDDLIRIFLGELKHCPLSPRIDELKKYTKKKLDRLCSEMKDRVEKTVQDKLSRLLSLLPDGPERREKAAKLLDARDARIRAIDELALNYLSSFRNVFPDLRLASVYKQFLLQQPEDALKDLTLPDLETGIIHTEDLAILCHLSAGIYGFKNEGLQHIVIDECQDFSPYRLALLKRFYPAATFSAVGDLAQGIHEDEGTRAWDEWIGPVFRDQASLKQLLISYRNTVEIMNAAAKVSEHFPIPGIPTAQPVLRHGKPVLYDRWHLEKERNEKLKQIALKMQAEGYHSIALVEKTPEDASALYRSFKKVLPVRFLTEKDIEYSGGILILPATLIKGLEFDCVILCNVSDQTFPADPFLTRLLYVMMTRPLHRLFILAKDTYSPLLDPPKSCRTGEAELINSVEQA